MEIICTLISLRLVSFWFDKIRCHQCQWISFSKLLFSSWSSQRLHTTERIPYLFARYVILIARSLISFLDRFSCKKLFMSTFLNREIILFCREYVYSFTCVSVYFFIILLFHTYLRYTLVLFSFLSIWKNISYFVTFL